MTPTNEDHSAHLDPKAVEEYFRLGAKTAFVLCHTPVVRMEIDPDREVIELSMPAAGADPEVTALERLSFARFASDGREWFRLRVDAGDMHYEAYVLIESIVDQLRAGASFRLAVSEALVSFRELLAGRRRLTDDSVLGLLGELLVLDHVVDATGDESAIGAWLGPLAEEHDFAFPQFDVEIKTTRSEARTHLIGSETQLEPSPGRPLYLLSIQLTRAGMAEHGFTLPSLIAQIRSKLSQALRTFESALEGLGWRDADADLYRTRYQFRSQPRAYLIDDQFPAITSARLDLAVPQSVHVGAVTYRVNVTDLDHSLIGSPLDDFCEASA